MAQDNKSLGRFELYGIPPAPRGVPQIEVEFNIDADGILYVTARDLGTKKEQSMRIIPSSGLTREEIERMKREAETHRAEDDEKRELAETRNKADTIVYHIEKNLREYGANLAEADRKEIEEKLKELKESIKGEDRKRIEKGIEELQRAAMKLGEAVYKRGKEGSEEKKETKADYQVYDDTSQ
ncbi:MAG: Hsp70 family protein, partial [candidate division WOR-3 bacterium]